MKISTFDRWLLGAGGLVILLVAVAALTFHNTRQLNYDAAWVAHTQQVIDALQDAGSHLREADAVQRTFIIVGGDGIPPDFAVNIAAARQSVETVQALTDDNEQQQDRIPDIQNRIDELAAFWTHTMHVRKDQGFAAAGKIIQAGQGRGLFAGVIGRLHQMVETERTLLEERSEKREDTYRWALLTGMLSGVAAVVSVVAFMVLLRRHLRARAAAAVVITEQRECLRTTLASIGDAVLTTDAQGRVAFLNRVAEQLTGWTQPEAAGQPVRVVFNIVNEETGAPVESPVDKVLREGAIVGLANHTVLIARDGTRRPIDDSGAPIRIGKEIAGAIIVFRDVTAKRTADNILRTSEERLRLALSVAKLGVWDWDVRSGEVLWNTHHEAIFGYTPGQPRRSYRDFADRVPPEELREIEDGFRQAMEDRKEYRFQHRVVWPDGTTRWVEAVGKFHFNEAGQATRSVGVLVDVTDRKRAEADRQKLAADLAEADRRKDEFLATLAHELRNPLAPIRNALEIIRVSPERQIREKAAALMERQLAQMVRLVDDLMDVSRITRGKLELRKEPVPLAAVLDSAVETSRPLIEQMGHMLTVALPEQPIVVDADLTRLAQVFANLLNNSAKYTDAGGRIWLTAQHDGSDVVVSVKDTGVGIADDQLPRLFRMFAQVDRSLEKSQGGLGIGLTLVKQLVEMHGGTVEAHSDGPGKGAEFLVRIPLAVETQMAEPADDRSRSEPTRSSLRILIVDDNYDSADSLALLLRMMGNETRTAYDGPEGVAAAGDYRPDVILLDIGLPKLNGYDACRRIREQPWGRRAIIVAVTGWGQEQDRRRSHEAGFDHHLVKPVDPRDLMKLLTRLQHGKPCAAIPTY